jgi:(p)ppGpp synthase/HD superfamily hydrolase
VFREPVCVRAFGVAKAAHDGRHRASGEPALLHCVEVARILAELGADEQTVSGLFLLRCWAWWQVLRAQVFSASEVGVAWVSSVQC